MTSRPLAALQALTRAQPSARKWLVGSDLSWGRELLCTLARRTGGWVGWEAVTLKGIAADLAFVAMAERGIQSASDIEIGALSDEALALAVRKRALTPPFARLSSGIGFRAAVRDAVGMLRVAGIDADHLRERSPRTQDIAAVLEEYERLLAANHRADPAHVFRVALEQFDAEAPYVVAPVIALAPDLRTAGLPGELLQRLVARGARSLEGDPAYGLVSPWELIVDMWPGEAEASVLSWLNAPMEEVSSSAEGAAKESSAAPPPGSWPGASPHADMFRAATPSDEVREVLRRIAKEGLRYEDVELVTTDRDTYGLALESLAAPLGIPVTSLHGIPLPRTRLGRAIARWLAWLEEGLPADILREALEAGELVAPNAGDDCMAPARLLRELAIGWGRTRWDDALARLHDTAFVDSLRRHEDEPDDDYAARLAARGAAAASLAQLLGQLLPLLPTVPERGSHETVAISIADLATTTLSFLGLVPREGHGELNACGRLETRLRDLAALAQEPIPFGAAAAALRDVVSEVRAWPSQRTETTPRTSTHGALHLTGLMHAGTTGRPRVFVLGLDADRTSGAPGPDPILDEEIRRALGTPALPTTGERIAQQRWALARALATLRGRITLSCAMSGDLSEREIGPSPALLQAHRHLAASPAADYDALRKVLGPPACAVPSQSGGVLDLRDAWLGALSDGKRLFDGRETVRLAHAGLAAGLEARALSIGDALSAHHGLVPAAAGAFDPRKSKRAISPSSLEELAKCPLAWFYRRGLGLRLPEEPAYDPSQWLDPRQRGSLLHEVFETFVRELLPQQQLVGTDDGRNTLERIVADALARWRTTVPPPSESVFESEGTEIREAARAFLAMEEEWLPRTGARWHVPELAFGPRAPVSFTLPDGSSIPIHGRIDRVDQLPGGGLVVIDFKTGSATIHRKSPKQGAFNGGRSLQAPIYASAAAAVLEGTVVAFEYRFPTVKGESTRVVYRSEEIALAGPVVQQLLDHVVTGHFLPTLDKADCSFCDCQPVCRVRLDKEDRLTLSPRAAWAKEHAATLPAYAAMLERRGARR